MTIPGNTAFPASGKRAHRPWSVRTVVIKISRKLTATYRIRAERSLSRLLAALLASMSPLALAELPTGLNVVVGQATVSTPTANDMRVNQASDKAILNWQSFNIGVGQSVQFVQPSVSSVALNRVVGNDASSIYGSLTANGQVFLINPAGVMFAPGAQVSVGGLVASSLSIRDQDFMAGRYTFQGAGSGAVTNEGDIRASRGGYVVLAAPRVSNTGTIRADAGSVGMLAGNRASIDTSGTGLVRFSVDAAAAQAAVNNSGTIIANGGQVALLASAVGDAMATVINHSGVIRANSAEERNGMIVLSGGANGIVDVTGELTASGVGAGRTGGTVAVLGDKVGLSGSALVNVSGDAGGGTALIGGNYQGKGAEQNASATFVGAGVTINVDAVTQGNGGKVVVWADDATRFSGTISARGGAQGGNGGSVETSGKEFLQVTGKVDASATNGDGGTWLLDPRNVNIANSTTAGGAFAGATFTPTADDATVDRNTIQTSLNGGTSVTVNTGASGAQAGDITIVDSITKSAGAAASLTLTAAGSIFVNNAVSSSSNALNVNLNATAATTFSAAGSLTTNGGNVAITGTGAKTLGAINTNGTVGTGNLTITTGGAVSQLAATALAIKGTTAVTAGAANDVTLGNTGNDFTGTVAVISGHNISIVDSNALTLGAITATGAANADGGNILVTAGGAITGTGAINASGGAAAAASPGRTAGSVNISGAGISLAANTITASGTAGFAAASQAGGNGGAITLTSTNGISGTGNITASGGTGSATNAAGGAGGSITINNSGTGSIVTGALAAQTGNAIGTGAGGAAGFITVSNTAAAGNVSTLAVTTAGGAGGNGGAVTLASQGNVTVTGTLGTSGTVLAAGTRAGSNAGDITITGVDRSITGAINANGSTANGVNQAGGNAGTVSITGAGTLGTVAINAQTGAATGTGAGGTARSITLSGSTLTAGALTTTGGANGNGGAISATSTAGVLTVGVITASGGAANAGTAGLNAGNVTVTGDSVNAAALTAAGSAGNGASMAGGSGGNVAVTGTSGNVAVGALSTVGANAGASGNANGGNAGTITLDAGGATPSISLGGNLSASGGNRVGTGTAGSGAQVWVKDAVLQTANVIVNTAGGTTGGTGGAIRFDGALNEDATARTLTLTASTGAVTLAGGAATGALTTLAATGAGIALGSVQTKGTQTYTGATTLNGNLVTLGTAGADTVTFNSPVTLTGHSSITTAGGTGDNITIAQTINGPYNFTLNAGASGNVTTSAGIGQTTALQAFGATGAAVSLGAVRGTSVFARSTAGNLTLTGAQTATGSGDSVVMVAKQNFINSVGAAAINPGSGRWLVYSTSPLSDTRNGLGVSFKQYNAAYGDGILGSGNGFIYSVAPTVTASLTGTVSKVYDGTTVATLAAGNYSNSGAIDGDVLVVSTPASGSYADKNFGAGKAVTVSGLTVSATNGAATVYGYQVAGGGTASGNIGAISKAGLTLTAQANTKIYDGNTSAAAAPVVSGVQTGDTVTGLVEAYSDKNAASGKTVSVTAYTVNDGNGGNNYSVTTGTAVGSISQKALGVTGQTATGKVYDASTSASLSGGTLSGVVLGDTVNLVAGAGTFADKNVGTAKAVAVAGTTLSGGDAANYTVANPVGLTANITPASVTGITGITASDKVQDGNTSATLATGGAAFTGRLGADVLSVAGATGNFDTPAVGNGKTVNITGLSLSGADAGNYNLASSTATTMASILRIGSGSGAGSFPQGALENSRAAAVVEQRERGLSCASSAGGSGSADGGTQPPAVQPAGVTGAAGGETGLAASARPC